MRGSVVTRLPGLRVRIPPGAWISVSLECCVLSRRGLCDEPCVSLSVIGCNVNPKHLQLAGRRGPTEKGRKKEIIFGEE